MAYNPAALAFKGGTPSSRYGTLAAANNAATLAGGYLYLNNDWTLGGDTTLTASLYGAGGHIILNGHTLTLTKNPSAPDYFGMFDASTGTGRVILPTGCVSELRWFCPTANGVADDTLPCQAWASSSKERHALPGVYVTDTFYFAFRGDAGGGGYSVIGDGQTTRFLSKSGNAIMAMDPTINSSININMPRIGNFRCENPGGYLVGTSPALNLAVPVAAGTGGCNAGQIFDVIGIGFAKGVWFDGDIASGSWINNAWFSATFTNVNAFQSGGHCIETLGPMNTYINCNGYSYGLSGGANAEFATIRVHGGQPTIIGMNCVYGSGQWGVICGDYGGPFNGSNDGENSLCYPTFIGCNFEICTAGGILVRLGVATVIDCTFTPNSSSCKAIYSNGAPTAQFFQRGTLQAQFGEGTWANNAAVHLVEAVSPWAIITCSGAAATTGADSANYKLVAYDDTHAATVTLAMASDAVPTTVGALPIAPYRGYRAVVTDATVTYAAGVGATPAGTGGNTVPVTFTNGAGNGYVIG